MITAQDYINTAFRKCGQMRAGYGNSPELNNDGLTEFQTMFDSFNAKRTMQYTQPDFIYPITGPGHGTTGNGQTFGGAGYQIGPTALDFVGPRPVSIVRMNLYLTSNASAPSRIPMAPLSMEEWTGIAVPSLIPTAVALVFAYDSGFPNGVIWVWPPLNQNSLEIFTWGALTPPTTLASLVVFPPGYADLIVWELAKRLWPLCHKNMMVNKVSHQWICGQAKLARDLVRDMNADTPRMVNDFDGGGHAATPVNNWSTILAGTPY